MTQITTSVSSTKRRSFLKQSFVGLSGALLLPNLSLAQKPQPAINENTPIPSLPNRSVFAIESGIFGQEQLAILGLLVVGDQVDAHEAALEQIRNELSYRSRLTYTSNDEFKFPYSQRAIAYFSHHTDLRLYLRVVSDFQRRIKPTQAAVMKLNFYDELLTHSGLDRKNLIVHTKSQSPYGPSPYFSDLFQQKMHGAVLKANSTYESNLLQLASFLTGTFMLDLRGGVKESSVRYRLLSELKAALNVDAFTMETALSNDKIVVVKPAV